MVNIEELEDVLIDEQVKEIYDSIDMEELNRRDKEHKKYLEYTKKEYHPISYQIDKELSERTALQRGITDEMMNEHLFIGYMFALGTTAFFIMIGGLFFLYLVLSSMGKI